MEVSFSFFNLSRFFHIYSLIFSDFSTFCSSLFFWFCDSQSQSWIFFFFFDRKYLTDNAKFRHQLKLLFNLHRFWFWYSISSDNITSFYPDRGMGRSIRRAETRQLTSNARIASHTQAIMVISSSNLFNILLLLSFILLISSLLLILLIYFLVAYFWEARIIPLISYFIIIIFYTLYETL